MQKLNPHMAYQVVITLLFILSLRTFSSLLLAAVLFLAILAVGAIDELTQPFVNRTASLTDWLANSVGIMTTLLVFVCFNKSKRQARVIANADRLDSDNLLPKSEG